MFKAKIIERVQKFIECPDCSDEILIDLLECNTNQSENLYCRTCGTGISVQIDSKEIYISVLEEKLLTSFVLLRSKINEKPIHIILDRRATKSVISETADTVYDSEIDIINSQRFFYNISCPASVYLRDIVCILEENELKPSDIFEYVATKQATFNESDVNFEEKLKRIFAENLNI